MLDKIIAHKKEEVERSKKLVPLSRLEEQIAQREATRDFARALSGNGVSLIAEVKKASPSRGLLCPDFNPVVLAKTYAQGGATAISVLTDAKFFQGSLDHLTAIKKEVELPLLRKDFVIDPYQIFEACAYGADALLLIVAVLSQQHLEELLSLRHSLGLKCLVEVHGEDEVERALRSGAEIIGINNRDLNTFLSDIDTTRRLRPLIPQEKIVVSESGIKSRSDVEKLKEWGANAILVGETLVTAEDVPGKMRELML
jgi:indole-3-glycerol phosphate synthase